MPEKKNNRILHKIIISVLVVVMVASGAGALKEYLDNKSAEDEYRRLAQLAQTTEEVTGSGETQTETEEQTESITEPVYESPIDFTALAAINPDIVGWITVPGTSIDYPILQTTDNDKYLHTSFEGEDSVTGAIFLDFESDKDMMGWNNILYGHNMRNGSMFKDVNNYKDEEYFKDHQEFYIYTPERTLHLKAIAAYYGEAKPIVRKTKFKGQENFDAFLQEMLSPCSYAEFPQVPVQSVYTLVTCSYEINDARTFLFAVDMDALAEAQEVENRVSE